MAKQTKKMTPKPSNKSLVLTDIFDACQSRNDWTFDNKLVNKISEKHDFSNPYDATKIDNTSILPDHIRKQGWCVVHLGQGKHKFVKALQHFFHDFEPPPSETIDWPYRKSVLNEINTSESNILSVGFNQRIIHDFLYEDIVANPKMYNTYRTKMTDKYKAGNEVISLDKVQMEIDMTTEYQGVVTVFEGKNKFPDNFSVTQLFLPFLYFHQLKEKGKIEVKEINCCYLMREMVKNESIIRLYLYTFKNPRDISTITLQKFTQYRLVKR